MRAHSAKKRKTKKPGKLARLLALVPTSCALLYPWYLAAQLDVMEDIYASAALPSAFDGLRMVFFSDVHYGALLKEDRVRSLVDRVNALQPDLILMGGDYGDDSDEAVAFFRLMPAFRARIAVLGALGNHDRTPPESNLKTLQDAMREAHVIPLVNDVWLLEKDGRKLAVAGIDDYYNGHPDIGKVQALARDADFTVFVPHTPDVIPETACRGEKPFWHLLLCGHTHGGQIALFGHSLHATAETGDRYRSGWYREGGSGILVSNGVGTTGFPVRLGARPQIHLITLKTENKNPEGL